MNLEGQLYRALEELWQVAITVSTLKYVAGLLSQETVNMISNSLDNQEEKLDPFTLDSEESNFEEAEAVADNDTVPREGAEKDEEERCLPSSVCHSVCQSASLLYTEDHASLASLVAHSHQPVQHEEQDSLSLVSHQAQDIGQDSPPTEIVDQELDMRYQTSETPISTNVLYNKASEPLEDDFSFISMVSHMISSPDLPEEYNHHITSSVTHQQLHLEEDFSEPLTSLSSHYTNIYYEMRQIEEEDIIEDNTYTEVEPINAIEEVEDVCDFTDQTDAKETEFMEEIKNLPETNLSERTENLIELEENCPEAETFDHELDMNFQSSETIEVIEDTPNRDTPTNTEVVYNKASEPLEDDFSFISMVSHQLSSPDLPEEYHHHITSSASHQILHLEEDFSEPLTSLSSHYTNIYYETEVREVEVEEEMFTEDYTFTDVEHLETIQELSEACDLTDQTDATETEFMEEIEDLPTINLDDVDIPESISEDVKEPFEDIPDSGVFEQELSKSHQTSEVAEDSIISTEEELETSSINMIEETEVSEEVEEIPTFNVNDADILDVISKDINEPAVKATKQIVETVVAEERDFRTFPSLQCHFMSSLDFEDEKLPSCVAHRVSKDVVEESDSVSLLTHTQHVFYLQNYPVTGQEYNQAESAAKLRARGDSRKFAREEQEDCLSEAVVKETASVVEVEEEHQQLRPEDSQTVIVSCEEDSKNNIPLTFSSPSHLEPEDTQYQDTEEGTDQVSADEIRSLPVREEVTELIAPYTTIQDPGYQGDFYTSMVTHQQPDTGLFEDFRDVSLTSSMQSHLYGMVQEDNDIPSLISHSILAHDTIEECSQLPLEEETSCKEEKSASDGVSRSYELESPIETSEREAVNQSCQSATESSEQEGAIQSYKLQLTRIKELQKLVEDELEEFDTKRKVKSNVVQATETEVVNIVKGIEFKSEIKINQLVEDEEDLDNTEDDVDSITENDNSNIEIEAKDQEATEQESIEEEVNEEEGEVEGELSQKDVIVEEELEETSQDDFDEEDEENLIHASCTLKRDNTVSISSNIVNVVQIPEIEEKTDIPEEDEADKNENVICQEEVESEEESDQDKREEELRSQLRTPPRKSVSLETKIRDRELLNSLLGDDKTRENVRVEDQREEMKEKPSILKQNKSTITLASLNENAKKQSYRIKFKVKLNDKTSKESSVMRYLFPSLFDYFHKKLFNAKH